MAQALIARRGGSAGGKYCWAKYDNQPNIPVGYSKVKYLSSSGTQIIDTGVIPNGSTKLVTTVKYTHTGTGYLFGCLNGWISGAFAMIHYANASDIQYLYGTAGGQVAIPSGVTTKIEMSGNGVYINDAKAANITQTNIGSVYSIYLFGRHNNTSATAETMTGEIGDTLIYGDGVTLSRELLCCLDKSGTPCMYDTVTKQTFYNIGTGTFGVGEVEYVVESPEFVLSNNENAYPDDGEKNGYYYIKMANINNAEPTMKHASGTQSASNSTLTVTGLGFKPCGVLVTHGNAYLSGALFDSIGNKIAAYTNEDTSNYSVTSANISVTDDGFVVTAQQMYSMSHTWWAVGQ